MSDGKHPNDPNSELTVKASADYWIAKGCPPEKMTIGLGAYGRVFKPMFGDAEPKRLDYGLTGPKGPITNTAGYMSYAEMCNWRIDIDPNIQAAYAISGQNWAGLETVEGSRPKVGFGVQNYSK